MSNIELSVPDLLQKTLRKFEQLLDNGDPTVALSAAGGLTKVGAELRHQERHAKQLVARLTADERDQLVLAHLANLSPEHRSEARRILDELESGESLLGT